MRTWTRRTLQRANGLLADARGAICAWPASGVSRLTAPQAGDSGQWRDRPGEPWTGSSRSHTDTFANLLPAGVPLVVNPRGLRPAYVRNDIFFQSIPLIQQHRKDVVFVCTSMRGQPEALDWMQRLNLRFQRAAAAVPAPGPDVGAFPAGRNFGVHFDP